jgi:hypothetical protein
MAAHVPLAVPQASQLKHRAATALAGRHGLPVGRPVVSAQDAWRLAKPTGAWQAHGVAALGDNTLGHGLEAHRALHGKWAHLLLHLIGSMDVLPMARFRAPRIDGARNRCDSEFEPDPQNQLRCWRRAARTSGHLDAVTGVLGIRKAVRPQGCSGLAIRRKETVTSAAITARRIAVDDGRREPVRAPVLVVSGEAERALEGQLVVVDPLGVDHFVTLMVNRRCHGFCRQTLGCQVSHMHIFLLV